MRDEKLMLIRKERGREEKGIKAIFISFHVDIQTSRPCSKELLIRVSSTSAHKCNWRTIDDSFSPY